MTLGHELIGRADELSALDSFLAQVRHDGAALVLSGEPGVGKSAVLAVGEEMAAADGIAVRRVTGVEFDTADRFAALAGLLAPFQRELTHLGDAHREALSVALALRPGPPPRREEVVGAATLAVLRRAAEHRALLLVVDDAQWLDSASASVLAFVARRLTGNRVGLIAVVRSGSAGPLAHAGLPEREIRPLGHRAASQLVAAQSPGLAPAVQARVLQEAQGLPLALLEFPLALTSSHRSGQTALPALLPARQRLAGLFRSRIDALPEPTRRVLLVAALEGRGDLAVISAAAAGYDPELIHLAAAEHAGLVRVDDLLCRAEFRHPLVRSGVVDAATPAARRQAHRALAEASQHWPGRRVWHLAEAADGPDEEVARLLDDAATTTLGMGDAVGAMTTLHRAAELSSDAQGRARRQIQAAFIGADVTGDLAGAAALLEHVDRLEPALTGSLASTVAASYLLLNSECDVDTAHRLLVAAIEAHPRRHDGTDPVLLDALHSLLMLSWFGGRRELWDPFDRAIGRLSSAPPDVVDLCHRTFGDPAHQAADVLPRLGRALADIGGELDPIRVTRLALCGVYTDRLGQCREALWRVIQDGREGGAVALAINALVSSCVDDWLTGRWDEAAHLAEEGRRMCEEHGYRRYSVILGGYIDQLVKVARGDLDGGRASADDMARWAADRGAGMSMVFAEHLRTLRAIASGDYEEAYRHAVAISPAGTLPDYAPHALWVLFDIVESAVHTGRHHEAAAHVAAMERAQLSSISPRLAMVTAGCAALMTTGDEAVRLFAEALDVPGGEQWPFDRGRIQLSFGEALRSHRSPAEARAQFREALITFEKLGARPWVARTALGLRAVGEAPRPSHQPAVAVSPQERRIAELAASGLTNREIGERLVLSHRSVGAALYRLFPKLGITSRVSLREALHLLDEPQAPSTGDMGSSEDRREM